MLQYTLLSLFQIKGALDPPRSNRTRLPVVGAGVRVVKKGRFRDTSKPAYFVGPCLRVLHARVFLRSICLPFGRMHAFSPDLSVYVNTFF